MIKLVGFAVSNYYNKVKLALLEKGVPFEEVLNWADKDEATLASSPLGKVPFVMTDAGPLCESQVIMEYIEDAYPDHPLLPGNAFARAKVRELVGFLEINLELVARRLYPQAFFGGKVSDEIIQAVGKDLEKGVAGFARLAKFSPYICGSEFTMADCAAAVHLPLIQAAGKAVYGKDLFADLPVKDYLALLGGRATMQKVQADRKISLELRAKKAG